MKEGRPRKSPRGAGSPLKCLSWIGERKKIHSFQARPLKFRGAQGTGCLSKKNFFADLF